MGICYYDNLDFVVGLGFGDLIFGQGIGIGDWNWVLEVGIGIKDWDGTIELRFRLRIGN